MTTKQKPLELASLSVTKAVFEDGTLETHEKQPVSARSFYNVMMVLDALRNAAFKDHDVQANYVLGDLNDAATNMGKSGASTQVHIETETAIGNVVSKILDKDRYLLPEAGAIIRDVFRADPQITIGPEYSVSAQHYIDQLSKKVPEGHHIDTPEGRCLPVVVVSPPKPVTISPEAQASFDRTADLVAQARKQNDFKHS